MTSKMLMTSIRSDDELTTQTSTKAITPAKSRPLDPYFFSHYNILINNFDFHR